MVGNAIYVETVSHGPSLLDVYDNVTSNYGKLTIGLIEATFVPPIELTVQDCIFDSNYATYRSGAVFIKTIANQLLMTNDLQLQSNISQGWDNDLAFNGLVVNIKILASNFTNNHGGALSHEGNGFTFFEISDSNFIWNTGSNGAAVNLQFYNTGAIVKVIDSIFDQNLAKHFGGAINIRVYGAHQSGEKMYIYIHHSNFINNAVKFNSKGSGAAI